MKIAILSQTYPPMVSGAAIVARGLAEGMAQRRHQVLVMTASDRPTPYLESGKNLVVKRLGSYHNPYRTNQRFTLWPHGEISAALREFAPQVIHTHDPFQLAWSGLLYGQRVGVPVILTIHQLPWYLKTYLPANVFLQRFVDKSLWAYSRGLLRRFQALVTPTQTIADEVLAHTGLASQAISYGVDPAIFHPGHLHLDDETRLRARLGIPDRVPILLYVGRLDKDKRVQHIIQAASRILAQNQAHLLIVGDGAEKANLMRLCQRLQISQYCHFPGFITLQQGLPDIYRLAYAFITASECETQGLVLLEAASCGLPIAAVCATCIPEIVHQGVNGWLAMPGDLDDLSRCIRNLLNNPLQAQAMGQAGRRLAQELTLQKTVNDYENLYRQAILLPASVSPVPEAA